MKRALSALGLTVFAMLIVGPLIWMLISSVKTGFEIVGHPWALPTTFQWVNYSNAWQQAGIGVDFVNSLVVCLATLAILLPTGAMAAYIFAKYSFAGKNLLFGAFLGGMMFPN